MGILEKIRKIVDGEDLDPLQELEAATPQPLQSGAEALKKRLLQEIEKAMRDRMFRQPNGAVYVPSHFAVFLNTEDDKQLRGEVRRIMEETLGGYAVERAQALNKPAKITAKAIRVELRVDGTLETGEIRAEAMSGLGTTASGDTVLTPPKPAPKDGTAPADGTIKDEGTIKDTGNLSQLLYHLEIWRNSVKEQDIPVLQRSLTVGREGSGKAANLRLKTDEHRISRLHFELICDEKDVLWVSVMGQNTLVADGQAVAPGEKKEVPRGTEIELYGFVFRPVFA